MPPADGGSLEARQVDEAPGHGEERHRGALAALTQGVIDERVRKLVVVRKLSLPSAQILLEVNGKSAFRLETPTAELRCCTAASKPKRWQPC